VQERRLVVVVDKGSSARERVVVAVIKGVVLARKISLQPTKGQWRSTREGTRESLVLVAFQVVGWWRR
jgi:hypothetical protein